MNSRYFRVLAFLLIVAVLLGIFYINAIKTPQPKIVRYTPPLGNILSAFFYATNTNYVDHARIDFYIDQFNKMPDSELKSFYQTLVWQQNNNLLDAYLSNEDATWNSLDSNGNDKLHYLTYWQQLRPIMQQFYAAHIKSVASAKPVIHFRCSDSPANRNIQYHLTKAASVQWMAEQIRQRGYSNVTLLSCNTHNKVDISCAKYTNFYAKLLSQYGLKVSTECNSVMYDFALMLNSPLLISLNASSYSFMAGVAKNPADYIACNMGLELNGKYYLQNQADWMLDKHAPLLHKDVIDYSDTAQVMKQLI